MKVDVRFIFRQTRSLSHGAHATFIRGRAETYRMALVWFVVQAPLRGDRMIRPNAWSCRAWRVVTGRDPRLIPAPPGRDVIHHDVVAPAGRGRRRWQALRDV